MSHLVPRVARTSPLLLLLIAAGAAHAAPPTRIAYTVSVDDPAAKRLHVRVRAEGVSDPEIDFALPAWSPGWYVLNDAARNVGQVRAEGAGGAPLTVTAAGPRRWKVNAAGQKDVVFEYDVAARDTGHGFFDPYVDPRHAFVPGPTTLVYVVGATHAPCAIRYDVPDGWAAVSGNAPVPDDPLAFTAPDYDTLADHPADLGHFERYAKTIAGVPIEVTAVGSRPGETARLAERLFRIAEAGIRIFGAAPFPRYVFQLRFADSDGFMGGLEHLNATVIRYPTRSAARPTLSDLRLAAHEFVHAWIVKRIRPEKLGPFDYSGPVRVKDLWLCEGVTDYYSPRLVAAAGVGDFDFWRGYVAEQCTVLQNNPARRTVTLEEASLKVWEAGDSEGYGGLSYYNKGFVVGWLLDVEMRRRTQNRVGLDHLMRELLRESERTGRGFADGALERAASRLTGTDLSAFFARALRSTDELDMAAAAQGAGLRLEERRRSEPHLGIAWDFAGAPAGTGRIAAVEPGSAAAEAGLQKGDVVLRIADLSQAFPDLRIGDPLALQVTRDGVTEARRLTVGRRDIVTLRLISLAEPTELQRAIRAAVSGAAPAPAP